MTNEHLAALRTLRAERKLALMARVEALEEALRHYASDPLFGNEARAALRNLDPTAIIAARHGTIGDSDGDDGA